MDKESSVYLFPNAKAALRPMPRQFHNVVNKRL